MKLTDVVAAPPPPPVIKERLWYVFSCVPLKSDECHAGIWERTLCGGTSTTAGCFMKDSTLHAVPKKGYVLKGIGPIHSQGRKRVYVFTSCDTNHALMFARDRLGTMFGLCKNFTNVVVRCHRRKVRGWGRLFPRCAGVWARIGRDRPQ